MEPSAVLDAWRSGKTSKKKTFHVEPFILSKAPVPRETSWLPSRQGRRQTGVAARQGSSGLKTRPLSSLG